MIRLAKQNLRRTIRRSVHNVLYETPKFKVCKVGESDPFIETPKKVGVVAIKNDQTILLMTQKREPVFHEILEIPTMEMEGVFGDPRQVVKKCLREMKCTSKSISPFVELYTSPGLSNERIFFYICENTEMMKNTPASQNVQSLSINTIQQYIKDGKIKDAKTIAVISRLIFLKKTLEEDKKVFASKFKYLMTGLVVGINLALVIGLIYKYMV